MNPTDEFILEAFKSQGLTNDSMLSEISAEIENMPESEVGDKDLSLMNLVLEKNGYARH